MCGLRNDVDVQRTRTIISCGQIRIPRKLNEKPQDGSNLPNIYSSPTATLGAPHNQTPHTYI